jgi:hypothetical protein
MQFPSAATVGAVALGVASLFCHSGAAAQTTAPAPGSAPTVAPATAPPPDRVIMQPTNPPGGPPEDVYLVRTVPLEPQPPLNPSTSFTFSAGYANLNSSGGKTILDDVDGYYFDTDFSFRLKPDGPLWAGISFNGSYFHEEHDQDISGTIVPTDTEVDAAVSTFCIEPRLTFVLLPKKAKGPYIAGKLGAGLLIADYWASRIVERPSGFFIDSEGDTTFAFEVRPGAQFGYSGGPWVIGAEVSEMWAWGDFNRLGDELNELRIGFFFTLRY